MVMGERRPPRTGGEKSNHFIAQGLQTSSAIHLQLFYLEDAPQWIQWLNRKGCWRILYFCCINIYCLRKLCYQTADVVFVDSYFHGRLALFHLITPLLKCSILYSCREPRPVTGCELPLEMWTLRLALQRATIVVGNSQYSLTAMERITPLRGKGKVIYPGFDRPPSHQNTTIKKKNQPIQLIYVAAVRPHKRLDFLVEVLGKLQMDFHLCVAGSVDSDPSYVQSIRQRANQLGILDNIAFVGHIDAKNLNQCFLSADIFLHPSAGESFGQVFLQAMALGLPIIAVNEQAAPEVVGDVGILLPLSDMDAWCQGIKRLASDTALRETLSHHAIVRAEQFPTWEQMVQNFEETLLELRNN